MHRATINTNYNMYHYIINVYDYFLIIIFILLFYLRDLFCEHSEFLDYHIIEVVSYELE